MYDGDAALEGRRLCLPAQRQPAQPFASPQHIVGQIGRDAVQPRGRVGRRHTHVEGAEGAHEGVLQQIGGVLLVPQQPREIAKQRRLVLHEPERHEPASIVGVEGRRCVQRHAPALSNTRV